MILKIFAVIGIIIAAFALVGFGMALANRYNRIARDINTTKGQQCPAQASSSRREVFALDDRPQTSYAEQRLVSLQRL